MQPQSLSTRVSSQDDPFYPIRDHFVPHKKCIGSSIITKLSSFLDIDLGRYHPSEQEFVSFISYIADLVTTIPNDLNSRLQQNSQSSQSPFFFCPNVIEDSDRIEVVISSWDFLSSSSDPLLSFPRFNVFRAKFPKNHFK
ncbi:hypothetical protein BLNAU_481 [Blattamonas nauphoetae]|uniref:Uncharacterized protein n=1 Tax=Blattamonas nauphoetae TaxID=2049346 RepID=A0ABQ9YLN7_9EUKA|nr:hypothetical protein BLNAU_481 [Blattamonas nauphoetae]